MIWCAKFQAQSRSVSRKVMQVRRDLGPRGGVAYQQQIHAALRKIGAVQPLHRLSEIFIITECCYLHANPPDRHIILMVLYYPSKTRFNKI